MIQPSAFLARQFELFDHRRVFPLDFDEAQQFAVQLIPLRLLVVVLPLDFRLRRADAFDDVFELLQELLFGMNRRHRSERNQIKAES